MSDVELDISAKKTIPGVLNSQKNIILFDCVLTNKITTVGQYGFTTEYNFLPSIAVISDRKFLACNETVGEISFTFEDAQAIFYDRKKFRTKTLNANEVESLVSSELFPDSTFSEDSAILAYFTGKVENFSAKTDIGIVSANNSVSYSIGGSEGANIKNRILMKVKFVTSVEVREIGVLIDRAMRLFEIICGRPQKFSEVKIVDKTEDGPKAAALYLNMYQQHTDTAYTSVLHPSNVLINAVQSPAEFGKVFCNWLARDESWGTARYRFSNGWREERSYSPDRLIGAANMFDLLPNEATGKAEPLSVDIERAIEECNIRLRNISISKERDEILNSLGRFRRQTLKKKIRYRLEFIANSVESYFPELSLVTDAAVDLRNIFVHGDSTSKKIEELSKFQIFLTNSLEFVFAASDLIESGWNISTWAEKPKGYGHPFDRFQNEYEDNLKAIKSTLEN